MRWPCYVGMVHAVNSWWSIVAYPIFDETNKNTFIKWNRNGIISEWKHIGDGANAAKLEGKSASEFATAAQINSIVSNQQTGNLIFGGNWTFSNSGVLTVSGESWIVSIPIDKSESPTGYIKWLNPNSAKNYPV